MKFISTYFLQILASSYCLLYATGFIEPIISGTFSSEASASTKIEVVTVSVAFLIFLIGVIYSFFNEKTGALLFMLWHILIWVFSLFVWANAGMVLILAFPVLILSAFMLNKYNATLKLSEKLESKWALILNSLLVNYFILYVVIIIWAIVTKDYDYYSLPFILFPILALLFFVGFFYFSTNKLLAGILFLLWYALVVFGSYSSSEFSNEGPHFLFGLTIFTQGILCIVFHFKFKDLK